MPASASSRAISYPMPLLAPGGGGRGEGARDVGRDAGGSGEHCSAARERCVTAPRAATAPVTTATSSALHHLGLDMACGCFTRAAPNRLLKKARGAMGRPDRPDMRAELTGRNSIVRRREKGAP